MEQPKDWIETGNRQDKRGLARKDDVQIVKSGALVVCCSGTGVSAGGASVGGYGRVAPAGGRCAQLLEAAT
jgi:hypothetical protein